MRHGARYPRAAWSRQKLVCFCVSLVAILALGVVGLAGRAYSASAAAGANTYTDISLTEISDGTDQGDSSACFVNTVNGFAVGDNTPTDGVVCSGDTVTYSTQLVFQAGPARTVAVDIDLPDGLTWGTTAQSIFCANGRYVTATRSGNTCIYTIPAGVSETVSNPLLLTGADTGGEIKTGQTVSLSTTLTKTGGSTVADPSAYNQATAKAVTVVSAPAVDVIMNSQDSCQYPATLPITTWTDAVASGKMFAVPCGLTYDGYSSSKGASTSNTWSGSIDVSSFPADTVFTLNGNPVFPINGVIPVTDITGSAEIDYSLPNGWPTDIAEGQVKNFDVSVAVDSNSFSTSTQLNNGDGSQPGDGLPKSSSTYDAGTGARDGNIYPNNDYSAVVVYHQPPPPPGAILSKMVYGPRDGNYTIWDSPNIVESESPSGPRSIDCYSSNPNVLPCNSVSRSTQLIDEVYVLADRIYDATGTDGPQLTQSQIANISGKFIIGDTWDPSQQTFDPTRLADFQLLNPAGGNVSTRMYVVQYATTTKTLAQVQDPDDTGWTTGTPNADATAVRFVVDEQQNRHTVPFYSEPGTGTFTMRIPLTVSPTLTQSGTTINDTAIFSLANLQSNDPLVTVEDTSGNYSQQVVLELPTTPTSTITNSVSFITHTNNSTNPPTQTITPNTASNPAVPGGDDVTYTVDTAVSGMPNSNPVDATVTIPLDPCQLAPVLADDSPWTMTVTPGSGTCGSPGATGATLTFTLKDTVPQWTNMVGDGKFPAIVYTTKSSALAPNADQVTDNATLHVTGVADDVTDDASYTSLTASDAAQNIVQTEDHMKSAADGGSKDIGLAEINRDLTWNADIYSYSGETQGGPIDSVIILPQSGGAGCTTGDSYAYQDLAPSLPGYTGSQCSDFAGSYTLSAASFDAENTSADAQLFCTTDARPTFDASAEAWIPYSASACANATALRVMRGANTTVSTVSLDITLTPVGNQTDDRYVMWMNVNTDDSSNVGYASTWPAEIDVVSSSLSGTVWWDDNSNGIIESGESGIGNVPVCLHEQNVDGTPGAVVTDSVTGAQRCTTTASDGSYRFENLNSGTYVVQIAKGTAIPDTVTTKYGQDLEVTETYSYKNNMGSKVSLDATATVPFDNELPHVDYGWVKPDPSVQLDKSLITSTCTTTSSTCTAQWLVSLSNDGNQPVTPTLTDVLSQKPITESVQQGFATPHVFTQIDNAPYRSVALESNGHIWSWGLSGGFSSTMVPDDVTPSGVSFTSIYVDGEKFAIDSDGNIWAWGDADNFGQLGNGVTTGGVMIPTQITGPGSVNAATTSGVRFTHISEKGSTVSALDEDGNIWAWGSGASGQLGNGTSSSASAPVQITGPGSVNAAATSGVSFTQVSINSAAVAVDSDGNLWTWGSGGAGQLGNGTTSSASTPVQVTGPGSVNAATTSGVSFVSASVNGYNVEAMDSDGNIWEWGTNSFGEIGDGTTNMALSPVQVTGPGSVNAATTSGVSFTQVSIDGVYSTIALDSDGNVWTWGIAQYGELGNGTSSGNVLTPTRITGAGSVNDALTNGVSFTSVLSNRSQYMSAAIDSNGHLWAWGGNAEGEVVGHTESYVLSPVDVTPEGVTFSFASIAQDTIAALGSDGQLWGWGYNVYGQVGNGTITSQKTPVNVTPPPVVVTGPFMSVTPGTNNDVSVDVVMLQPGESTSVVVSATYMQKDFEQIVSNQAYVDSPNTPIAGLLEVNGFDQAVPDSPVDPAVADYNSLGVPGNLTCDTNVDTALATDGSVNKSTGFTTMATEDSCDQVPAEFPAYTVAPSLGNLTGQTWYDENKDGLEQSPGAGNTGEYMVSGMTVTLTQTNLSTGASLPAGSVALVLTTTTSTGSDGKLDCDGKQLGVGQYAFCSIPASGYSVQFGISDAASPSSPNGSYTYTKQTGSQAVQTTPPSNLNSSGQSLSIPGQDTGLTPTQKVIADATTTNVNAGLISTNAQISIVKDSATYSDQGNTVTPELPINPSTGKSVPVSDVTFTITNTGDDILSGVSWSDTTTNGPTIMWISCTDSYGDSYPMDFSADRTSATASASAYDLYPGDSIECTGTSLAAMNSGTRHDDIVTVSARGQTSLTTVTASDPWSAQAPLQVGIEKLAANTAGVWGPMVGSQWQISTTPDGGQDPSVGFVLNPSVTTGNVWTVIGLKPGTNYWLTELTAPKGFSLLATSIEFTVDDFGDITLVSGQGSGSDIVATSQLGTGSNYAAVPSIAGLPVISVRDVPNLNLPETGGSGTRLYVIFAVGIAGAAAVMVFTWRLRRREEKGAKI